jgi:tetratricopeptide (TPR) repeat protein
MKKFIIVLLLCNYSVFYAQDNVDKIVTVARQACECISKIDTSLDKAEKGKEIKACITNANLTYQLNNILVESTEKPKDSSKTSKVDTLILDKNKFNIVLDEDLEAIEDYLYENCTNMRDIYFSDDKKMKNSLSDKDIALEYYNNGIEAFDNQDYQGAIKNYNKAVEIDSKFAFAWDNLGLSYRYVGEFNKAIECYEKSLKVDPKGRLPMLNIAITYEYLKDYDKAKKAYKKYGRVFKKDPESFYGLGRIYSLEKNYEEGLDNMIQAYILYIEIDSPYKADAENNIAYMYQELKKENKLEIFNKLAKKYKLQVNQEN